MDLLRREPTAEVDPLDPFGGPGCTLSISPDQRLAIGVYHVPNEPSIVGVTGYFQALLLGGTPLALQTTNGVQFSIGR